MKRKKLILLFAVLVMMHACMVSSLHPFYKKEDKIYTTQLLGSWMDADSCLWTFEPNQVNSQNFLNPPVHDSSYIVRYYEDSAHVSVLVGTLFQLDGIEYMDFTPHGGSDQFRAEFSYYHHVPVHTLARISYSEEGIAIYWFGEEWISNLFEENRIRIKHERIDDEFERHVLTADTDELQKFVKKYGNSPQIVKDLEGALKNETGEEETEFGIFTKLMPLGKEH